jgi:AcrR family transcriptional regulator
VPRVGDTRTKILEVAESEFAAEGYAGAHLQKIAEQVGVRKTALYYYF